MGIRLFRFLERAGEMLRRFARRHVHHRAQRDADRMAALIGIEVEHRAGGSYDAFTHAYVSARLTIALSPELAERMGDLNEMFGSLAAGKNLEAKMDLHNNAIGREIGIRLVHEGNTSKRKVAESVRQALDTGKLRVIDKVEEEATLVPSGM